MNTNVVGLDIAKKHLPLLQSGDKWQSDQEETKKE